MIKSILPLGLDEIIALIVLACTVIFSHVSFIASLQGLAVVYLLMCVAFRKYEILRQKHGTARKN